MKPPETSIKPPTYTKQKNFLGFDLCYAEPAQRLVTAA